MAKYYIVKRLALDTHIVYYIRNKKSNHEELDLILGTNATKDLLLFNDVGEVKWIKVGKQKFYRKIAKQLKIAFNN